MKPIDYNVLLDGIDRGIDAHLAWNQRLFRCALLRESPGDDVLLPNSHELCQFGTWFNQYRVELNKIDQILVQKIDDAHRLMHDGVRTLAISILENVPAMIDDLQLYQEQQSNMINMLHVLHQEISELDTHKDYLTGLPLRHGLEQAFTIRQHDSHREDLQLWLLLADIDKFKSINDSYGHSVGDQAIKHIAENLLSNLRTNDILFRYGGEEFLILLLLEAGSQIENVASRILKKVTAPLVLDDNKSIQLTVTLGLTRVTHEEKLKTVIDRADFALLEGKNSGRNCYVIS